MRKVILDGRKMTEKSEVHLYLKQMIGMKGYDGNNLDALWDVLSTYDKPIQIELYDMEEMLTSLGSYGKSLVKTFEDAKEANPNIHFEVKGV